MFSVRIRRVEVGSSAGLPGRTHRMLWFTAHPPRMPEGTPFGTANQEDQSCLGGVCLPKRRRPRKWRTWRSSRCPGRSPRESWRECRGRWTNDVPAETRPATVGDTGREMFIIVDGRALMTIRHGRRVHVGPGDCFDETRPIDGDPRPAAVEAAPSMRLPLLLSREVVAGGRVPPDDPQDHAHALAASPAGGEIDDRMRCGSFESGR
jgi:hypothetical protein